MNGLPLWIAIFVTGLVIGVLYPAPESSGPVAATRDTDRQVFDKDAIAVGYTEAFQAVGDSGDNLERTIEALTSRLKTLESRVAFLEEAAGDTRGDDPAEPLDAPDVRPAAVQSPSAQSNALAAAGFEQSRVDDILRLHSQHQLERLEIQDLATREGWRDTPEFRQALRAVGDRTSGVRAELSDVEYDRYLFALGLSNRVELQTIIPEGEAELAGMLPGDVISAYAGERVFRVRELQAATSAGERGELVPVQIVRDGEALELYVPRGPLGVTITGEVVRPAE